MTQISFPLDEANEALDRFLNDGEREHDGRRMARHILDANGDTIADIIDPAERRELISTYHAFQKSQEPNDAPDLPAGFRPYIHSPNATENRLLPTEPLRMPLAHAMYGKPHEELTQTEQDRITGVAIHILLRVTLDEDTQGAVPILMVSHAGDDPEPRQFWQLAYKTDTDGLFLRADGNGFFGAEWQIVTGSGLKLLSGWFTREDAGRAAAAIGRVLPYIDWMSATSEDFTDASKKALAATVRRYHFAGVREDQPEPEPLATT
ncbi:hypothetical protein ASD97_24610 [Streptomyces sp. Root63]|uniref:hypothetical protein n=1 Tax=Streptomyces TaxID=1883 RepID=UPI0006F8D01A|nr:MULTISPECIES: hypothetical protein [unclassified Streptomyces]KQX27488.1 hypothetical protein ASD29_29840 [Streptomyces sp. Root1295]KRA34728.1 hypothetical protein ASD97_24610 [Streptomyces sp. Root63]WTC69758.1 hypothetical protein OG882_05190 [Streptomyces anulatus]